MSQRSLSLAATKTLINAFTDPLAPDCTKCRRSLEQSPDGILRVSEAVLRWKPRSHFILRASPGRLPLPPEQV